MTTMVERVARAVMVASGCGATVEGERVFCDDARIPSGERLLKCDCGEIARAAIWAMREPTEVMTDAGHTNDYVPPDMIWRAMLDAALAEGGEPHG